MLNLNLPEGCEFGVCGAVVFDATSQNPQLSSVQANCRWVEAYHLGMIFGADHCDASVSIGDGYLYSISAGPIHGRLRGFVTKRAQQTTGDVIYWNGGSGANALGQCLIATGNAHQASKNDLKYNGYIGPNSNNWLNTIFAACGVNLGLHAFHTREHL